jgi:hypothetical protein
MAGEVALEMRPMAVDIHCHYFVAEAAAEAAGRPAMAPEPTFGGASEEHSRRPI